MARGECDLAKTRPAAAQPHLENRGKAHDFFPFFFLTGGGDRLSCLLVDGGGGGRLLRLGRFGTISDVIFLLVSRGSAKVRAGKQSTGGNKRGG